MTALETLFDEYRSVVDVSDMGFPLHWVTSYGVLAVAILNRRGRVGFGLYCCAEGPRGDETRQLQIIDRLCIRV